MTLLLRRKVLIRNDTVVHNGSMHSAAYELGIEHAQCMKS